MDSANLISFLKDLEAETGLPYNSQKKVLTTIFNLVRKYSGFEAEEVMQAVVDRIADGTVGRLYRGRKDDNLSLCVWYATKWKLGNMIAERTAQKRNADLVSFSALTSEGTEIGELIGDDYENVLHNEKIDSLKHIAESLNPEDKLLYVMLWEDKTTKDIAEVFDCSASYASRMVTDLLEKIRKRMIANEKAYIFKPIKA